jgi:hypothetical protein
MGCLNSSPAFDHWFGNVHLSGPCNRACYFCIGQHMMALDGFDTRDTWPLEGLDEFMRQCRERRVSDVWVSGTNTDHLLYRHTEALVGRLRELGVPVGVRTNGIAIPNHRDRWLAYDKASVTVCSLDPVINASMMGGPPADLSDILHDPREIAIYVVLGPENRADVPRTLDKLCAYGPRKVNLREPYGQPHQGNPLSAWLPDNELFGMPVYKWGPLTVTYWDVHYVAVNSVNLYASGRVSVDYPITRGHAEDGSVNEQSAFPGGRVRAQWVKQPALT